jgi:PKD repeat protein
LASTESFRWSNVTGSVGAGPSTRLAPEFAYDPLDRFGVLAQGYTPSGAYLNDTWTFNGTGWTNITPYLAEQPPAREQGLMTFDPVDGYFVLFGGFAGATILNDTWSFSGRNWTRLDVDRGPPPTDAPGLAWDPLLGAVVLYANGATWTFVRGSWSDRSAEAGSGPGARLLPGLGYDAEDGLLVLFGGERSAGGTILNDTWVLGAGAWTKIAPGPAPSPRFQPALADLGELVLFGGDTCCGLRNLNDTWVFLGGGWSNITATAGTAPRASSSPYFDRVLAGGPVGPSAVAYLRGGISDDTWQLAATGLALSVQIAEPAGPVCAREPVPLAAVVTGAAEPVVASWQFGDGTGANGTEALHAFASAGNFTLALDVVDALGRRADATRTLEVAPGLSVHLLALPTSGYVPLVVRFQANGSGGAGGDLYVWDFGDGSPIVAGPPTGEINHTYSAAGLFSAQVTVEDRSGGSATATVAILPAAVPAPLSVALGEQPGGDGRVNSTTFWWANVSGGVAPYTVNWSTLAGPCDSVTQTLLECRPSAVGAFTVTVTVTDPRGDRSTAQEGWKIDPELAPLALTLRLAPDPVATGANFTAFANLSSGFAPIRYTWSGLPAGCPSPSAPRVTCPGPDRAGASNISVTVSDALGRNATARAVLVAEAPPGPTASPDPLLWLAAGALAGATFAIVLAVVVLRRRRPPGSAPGSASD